MNEFVAVASFVGLACIVLVAAKLGPTYLFVLSTTFILLSNITVQMPVAVFGFEISWAIIIYSLVYFITDILCEYYGRRAGFQLATANLFVQILLWCYVGLSLQVTPVASGTLAYDTMSNLFGTTAQVTFAAIAASAGPYLDIFIFSWIRAKWDATARGAAPGGLTARVLRGKTLALIARNKLSTLVGQVINTVLFFSLAFLGTGTSLETMLQIIVTASVVKVVIALADIPFLVAVSKWLQPTPVTRRSAVAMEHNK